jgi:hypothetical protein
MTEYGDQAHPDKPGLSAHQQEMLDLVQHQELLETFNQVLIDRGIPLEVARVDFNDLPLVPVSDAGIGPDPSAPPDTSGGTPGAVYTCTQSASGHWVCICDASPDPPPVSVQAPPGSGCS